jgi:hypothetical protein
MSMEIYVLSDRRVAAIQEWQRVLDAEGLALRLSDARSFDALEGHLPACWRNKPAGFECDHWSAAELIADFPQIDFGCPWKHALAFRWGFDLDACQGAYMAAAAYTVATDGVLFDPVAGSIWASQEAVTKVREMEEHHYQIEAMLRDIERRYASGSTGSHQETDSAQERNDIQIRARRY